MQVYRLKVDLKFSSLQLSKVKRIIDQREEESRRTLADVEPHLASWVDEGLHADKTVLDGINWRAKLVADRCEHNLDILLHDLLSLQFFLSWYIGEDKDDLLLRAKVVRLNPDVIVDAIEVIVVNLVSIFLFLERSWTAFLILLLVFFVARRDQALVHMKYHTIIGGHLDHLEEEALSVDIGDFMINWG